MLDTSVLIADERGKFDMTNVAEFQRVTGLRVVDASAFRRP